MFLLLGRLPFGQLAIPLGLDRLYRPTSDGGEFLAAIKHAGPPGAGELDAPSAAGLLSQHSLRQSLFRSPLPDAQDADRTLAGRNGRPRGLAQG